MVSMLAFSCLSAAVALSSAIKLPAQARAIISRARSSRDALTENDVDAADRPNGLHRSNSMAKLRHHSDLFVHDLVLEADAVRKVTPALIVVVISSDQIETVQRSMTALGHRADWLICVHANVGAETKASLTDMSTSLHGKYGISVRIMRPLDDAFFVPKQVFWVHAIQLDKDFILAHDNVWLVDSDIDFEGFAYDAYMLRHGPAFMAEPPLISQPVINQSTQYFLYWNNDDSWNSRRDVAVAYSTLVEIQAAMVDTKFFVWLLARLRQLVFMQKQMRSDWIFDDVWCGGAAMYLEDVLHKSLKPGTSPCAIITLPIGHEDHHSIVKDESFKSQNTELTEWALVWGQSPAFHDVLSRQRALVAEMKLFTPWPNQQCEACSRNQCSDGVPMGKCCFTEKKQYEANGSCTLNLAIADTHDITQVVSPASQSHMMHRSLIASSTDASVDSLGVAPADIRTAFQTNNGALFIIAVPEQEDQMLRLAQDSFQLPRERIVVVPGVANQSSDYSALVSRGIVAQEYWQRSLTGDTAEQELSSERVASYLAHLRAHKMFLDSSFDVALFLEGNIDARDVASAAWQRKAHTLFTSNLAFGQAVSNDSVALYLGYCSETCPSWARSYDLGTDVTLRDAEEPRCTHAYSTNRKASEFLVSSAMPMDAPLDWVMPRIFKGGQVRSFIVNPPMLWQRLDNEPMAVGADKLVKSRSPFCDGVGCSCRNV